MVETTAEAELVEEARQLPFGTDEARTGD